MKQKKLTQAKLKGLQATIQKLDDVTVDQEDVATLLSCLDLTNLDENATLDEISALCEKSETPMGNVAAVCVFPRYVEYVFERLRHNTVKVATVVNFPDGDDDIDHIKATTQDMINAGAQEIDIVIPYVAFLEGDDVSVIRALKACQGAMTQMAIMKVIIETGAFEEDNDIYQASMLAIQQGADFLKTSTGKHALGASFETAAIMMQAIKDVHEKDPDACKVGIKISGGVRSTEEACQYFALARSILGEDWLDPTLFRIGSSRLLQKLVAVLEDETVSPIKENIDQAY